VVVIHDVLNPDVFDSWRGSHVPGWIRVVDWLDVVVLLVAGTICALCVANTVFLVY
jgi:hypothetical protein